MKAFMPRLIEAYYTQHKRNFSHNHVFNERMTTSYELVYFLDDSNCKMLLDHTSYHILGDSIVFRRPGQLNRSFMPYESILLCFDWDWAYEEKDFVASIPTLSRQLEQIPYRQIFEGIYQESLLNRPYAMHYISGKLMEILYGLYYERLSGGYHRQSMVSHSGLIDMLHYIDDHLREPFTMETMSSALSISQRYIYKLFREHLNMTPVQYINRCRINYAKRLLKHSNVTVNEIASMSGFINTTYFITLFRRLEGITPLKYRQKNKRIQS